MEVCRHLWVCTQMPNERVWDSTVVAARGCVVHHLHYLSKWRHHRGDRPSACLLASSDHHHYRWLPCGTTPLSMRQTRRLGVRGEKTCATNTKGSFCASFRSSRMIPSFPIGTHPEKERGDPTHVAQCTASAKPPGEPLLPRGGSRGAMKIFTPFSRSTGRYCVRRRSRNSSSYNSGRLRASV